MNKVLFYGIILVTSYSTGQAQPIPNPVSAMGDTTSIVKPAKISHAEPLYLDLVRDLGARKGEREWNVGTQFSQGGGHRLASIRRV